MSEGIYSQNPNGTTTYTYPDGSREVYSAAGEMLEYVDSMGRTLYQKTTGAAGGTVSPWLFMALAAVMFFMFKEKK